MSPIDSNSSPLSTISPTDLTLLLRDLEPEVQLQELSRLYPASVVFSTSFGKEDQVITDLIARSGAPIRIVTLDTGRLFGETYELADRTRNRYKVNIEVYYPEASQVERMVTKKGFNSFYDSVDNRKECCSIRKVQPLRRALAGMKVWITGLRREQSVNRKDTPLVDWASDLHLHKFNPLVEWTSRDLDQYLQEHKVPYNPLHDKGFLSIGCAPCTRAIQPGEDERAGRWWWEMSKKECGLHTERATAL